MPLPLLALFLTAFGIGTAEFVIAGLLPDVAVDLGISIPTAGYLITYYAIGVAVGGPLLALLSARFSRRSTILVLVAGFTIGQALCALAPSYEMLLIARVAVAFSHGAYFGVAAIVATRLVPEDKRGSAVALLLAGITVANILGVPGGTAIGNIWGWRATFWAVGLLSLVAFIATALLLPKDKAAPESRPGIWQEIRVLGQHQVYLSMAIIMLAMIGQFSLFTYIAPLLTEVTGLSEALVPWILLLFGVGSTIGVFIGGRLADWKLMPSLMAILALQALVYIALAYVSTHPVLMACAVLLWGGFGFAFGAPVQSRVLKAAGESAGLASTLIPTGFNVGIAIGASLGAAALERGFGYASLPWIGAVAFALALGIAMLSALLDKRAGAHSSSLGAPA